MCSKHITPVEALKSPCRPVSACQQTMYVRKWDRNVTTKHTCDEQYSSYITYYRSVFKQPRTKTNNQPTSINTCSPNNGCVCPSNWRRSLCRPLPAVSSCSTTAGPPSDMARQDGERPAARRRWTEKYTHKTVSSRTTARVEIMNVAGVVDAVVRGGEQVGIRVHHLSIACTEGATLGRGYVRPRRLR